MLEGKAQLFDCWTLEEGWGSRVGDRARMREYIQADFWVLNSSVGLLLKGSMKYSLFYMSCEFSHSLHFFINKA